MLSFIKKHYIGILFIAIISTIISIAGWYYISNVKYFTLFNSYYRGIDAGVAEGYSYQCEVLFYADTKKFLHILNFYSKNTIDGTCYLLASGITQSKYNLSSNDDELQNSLQSVQKTVSELKSIKNSGHIFKSETYSIHCAVNNFEKEIDFWFKKIK